MKMKLWSMLVMVNCPVYILPRCAIFTDLSVEFGLLLWHDFQFACGVYPGAQFPEFVESVKKEAEDNVKRFRNHPCMALWCGNNEDYQMVLQWGGK